MDDVQDDDLILVAFVKTPRDLEIARVLGWYRIPLARAPGTMRVDWLAFFQGAPFGRTLVCSHHRPRPGLRVDDAG